MLTMELLQIEKIDVQLYCCLTVVLLFGGHYSTILHIYIYLLEAGNLFLQLANIF